MSSAERSSDPEISRLERVYGRYRDSDSYRKRWDRAVPGNQAIDSERWRIARAVVGDVSTWPPRLPLVEVGCGTGHVLARLASEHPGAGSLVGIDVLADRLAQARDRSSSISCVMGDGRALPVRTSSCATAVAFTLFSSIMDRTIARSVAREVDRVLEPGGLVLWYDYRISDPRNRDTTGMPRAAVSSLFPRYATHLRSVTLVPQIARRIRSVRLYALLASVPFLRTHYCGVLVKPSDGAPAAS